LQKSSTGPTELRDLRRSLSDVSDAQLVQVVALIDRMAERGSADDLIGPLRGRLGQLSPPRPLRFARLLFLPLDPLIVSAPRFRAGTPTVPRTALAPFSELVRAALGARADAIEAAVAGRAAEDEETIRRVGEVLWPEAAAILAHSPQPPGWAAAGLPAGLHKPLACGIAAVLEQAAALHAIVADAAAGLPIDIDAVDAALSKAAPSGPEAWGFVLAVLLGRLPDVDAVLRQAHAWTARRGDPALRAALDMVAETQLARLEAHDGVGADVLVFDLAEAGGHVHRLVGLLDGLTGETPPAAHRARLAAIRTRLDAGCRARFADSLASEFLAPLRQLSRAPVGQARVGQAADPAALQRLEASARQLRALETEARRLGGASAYDALLSQTAAVVRGLAPEAGLALAEKVRLIEILAGPDEALALLTSGASGF
jgi:hypothetical protein